MIMDKRTQMAVTSSKIGEIGRCGRASRESARLNGRTLASGNQSSLLFSICSRAVSLFTGGDDGMRN